MSVDAIADVWNVEAVEIVKTLELMRSGKDTNCDLVIFHLGQIVLNTPLRS